MKNKKVYAAAFGCMIGMFSLSAQNIPNYEPGAPLPCRTDEAMRDYFKSHPQAYQNFLHPQKTRAAVNRPDAYVIPVVFHVFGTDFNGKTITDEKIIDALKKTNEDFQGLTFNTGDDNPDMNKLQGNMNITFKLAEIGPNGEATTGITYHRLEKGFGNYDAPHIYLYAWDNTKYMNVYVMNDLYGDGVTNNSGVSWYPDMNMTQSNIARVVYNGAYIGSNTNENMRRVLTHEFGHFLNLAHTFDDNRGEWPDGCKPDAYGRENPGDWVDDTPKADVMLMGKDDRNCEGDLTNWTNYMNYSYERSSMYTKGQVERMKDALDMPSRNTLWAASNLKEVFFTDETTTRIVLCSRDDISEATTNDGRFEGKFEFKIINDKLANKQFVHKTDYEIIGLPEGLTPVLTRLNDNKLQLSFTGNAEYHDADFNIHVNFKASITEGGNLYNCQIPLLLTCRYTYGINHTDCYDYEITSNNYWTIINIDDRFEDSMFGLMWNVNQGNYFGLLYLESFGKPMIGKGKTNLTLLPYGEEIGKSSHWLDTLGDYPALGTLASPTHTENLGKTGFVGIQFQGEFPDEIHYGWLRVRVAEDGKSFTVLDYAYNEEPHASILAGQKSSDSFSELSYSTNVIRENAQNNDGSIASTLSITIKGKNKFKELGALQINKDYTISELPEGLTPHINVISQNEAVLSFEGKALKHNKSDNKHVLLSIINKDLFTDQHIENSNYYFDFSFFDLYKIVSGSMGVGAGAEFGEWMQFSVPEVLEYAFGAWEFAPYHLKLETYHKPMVCVEGTRNIKPLDFNTEIGPNSNWVKGGNYAEVLDLATPDFKDWRGITSYAGFSFQYLGNTLYGWFEISVTGDGALFRINKYGYNEQPDAPILAGQTENKTGVLQVKSVQVNAYPNPCYDYLNIDLPANATYEVTNIEGIVVASGRAKTNQIKLDVVNWNKGIYVVHITHNTLHTVCKIVVK